MEQNMNLNQLRTYRGYLLSSVGPIKRDDDTEVGEVWVHLHPIPIDGEPLKSVTYLPEHPENINKAIEEAKEWIDALRRCRKCGCTEYDCKSCIEKTGSPCHWVETDLCSACKEEPIVKVTDSRASSGTTDENVTTANFFRQLASANKVDLTLRIMEVNGKFTVLVDPGIRSKGIIPTTVTGTPEQLDERFFKEIMPGVQEVAALVSNLPDVLKQAKDKVENGEDGDDNEDSKEEKKGSKLKRQTNAYAKKKETKKPAPKAKAEKPVKEKVEEPSLFGAAPTE